LNPAEVDMRRLAGITLALACLVLSGGCGGSTATVEGAVTYDGKPVPAGAISFLAADGKGGSGGASVIDGAYRVPPEPGLKPGTYKVEIRWAKPTGKKFKSESGDILDMTEEGLPEKYNTKSDLKAEVKPGSNKIDFDLPK
jgi:hypothetical protein